MVFITSHASGKRRLFIIQPNNVSDCLHPQNVTFEDILQTLFEKEGVVKDVFLSCEGKPVGSKDMFTGDMNIVATLKLKGGKGGFGSMLRAIGAQIEKTTNREACRDLSGRRLRDINEEKRLKEYLAKKVEKEKETLEQKRKKLEQMKEGPKHTFEDKKYFEQREKRERDVYDSLDKVFSSTSGTAAPRPTSGCDVVHKKKVKSKRMLGDLDESSDEESESEEETPSPTKAEDKKEEQIPDEDEETEGDSKRKTDASDEGNRKRLKAN